MPITIGRKIESDYSNPLGLLSDCHQRIERFLDVLITVTKHEAPSLMKTMKSFRLWARY